MKTLLILLCGILSVSASEVTLTWDYPTPTPTNLIFVLYGTTNATLTATNLSKAQMTVNCGTNKTVQAVNMTPGQWRWAVAASQGGVQSDLSNVLVTQVPVAPDNVRTVALQYSFSLETGTTNWPAGMYIRIVP